MLPRHFLQNHSADEMRFAVFLMLVVDRTLKEILPLFKILGGAVVHLLTAVSAVHQTGEQAGLSCLGSAVTLLPDLLNLVKHINVNNGFMGSVEDRLLLYGIPPFGFIPDRVGVGFEIDYTSGVFSAFQNFDNSSSVPPGRILRNGIGCFLSRSPLALLTARIFRLVSLA